MTTTLRLGLVLSILLSGCFSALHRHKGTLSDLLNWEIPAEVNSAVMVLSIRGTFDCNFDLIYECSSLQDEKITLFGEVDTIIRRDLYNSSVIFSTHTLECMDQRASAKLVIY